MDVEVAQSIEGRSRVHRWIAVLVGVAAVTAASLATLDLHANKRYENLQGRSSRQAVDLFGRIAGSSFPFTTENTALQAAIFREVQSLSRQLAARIEPQTTGFETAIADADHATADRLKALADSLGEVPPPESGVDPLTRSVIATDEEALQRLVTRQNGLVDEATRYGNRSSRAVFALSLVALATVLLGLAAGMGSQTGAPMMVGSAGVILLVAIGWGISAFFE